MDFGNAPILRTLPDGRTLIVIGQKDGHAWALDPDKKGAVVWQRMVGLGLDSGGGGMQWGSAADDKQAYFPVTRAGPTLGLAALNLATGELAWRHPRRSAAPRPLPLSRGLCFLAPARHNLRLFDGRWAELWNYNTAKEFTTVNGVAAKGGGMSGSGPVVAEGMLFVPSGSADLFGGNQRGNVLLAFGVD